MLTFKYDMFQLTYYQLLSWFIHHKIMHIQNYCGNLAETTWGWGTERMNHSDLTVNIAQQHVNHCEVKPKLKITFQNVAESVKSTHYLWKPTHKTKTKTHQ